MIVSYVKTAFISLELELRSQSPTGYGKFMHLVRSQEVINKGFTPQGNNSDYMNCMGHFGCIGLLRDSSGQILSLQGSGALLVICDKSCENGPRSPQCHFVTVLSVNVRSWAHSWHSRNILLM